MIPNERAVAFFSALLACQTDVSDVHTALSSGDPGFVLIDTRGGAAWRQGHIAQAKHLPRAELAQRAPVELDHDVPVVVYCWGPGCNGATKSALELATLGYQVKEMIGGIEYWIREGLPVRLGDGSVSRHPADPLTAPRDTPKCDC